MIKIKTTALFIGLAGACFAQVSPEEHAKHHPGQNATAAAENSAAPSASSGLGGMMGSGGGQGMGGMMGGGGGQGMGGMMEQMGAPKPKEMYPSLMSLPDLPLEDRAKLKEQAHERMQSGVALIGNGLTTLSESAATDHYSRMQEAVSVIKEGLSRFDSGLSAHRALAEGKAPRNVALEWFKREMNLLPPAQPTGGLRILGLSPLHGIVMASLIAFFVIMIAMYFFKMRRASHLLQRLSGGSGSGESQSKSPSAAGAVAPSTPAKKAQKWSGSLELSNIFPETPEVKTFRFTMPDRSGLPFDYKPSQFLTLKIETGGQSVKRSYTIASSPTQRDYIEITVKREAQGVVSRHLHDQLKVGDTVEVSAPAGNFTFTGEESGSIVLIAGGVGITPMMSILRYLTDRCWGGDIYFIFCVRTEAGIIFRNELELLAKRHPNVKLHITLTNPESDDWQGPTGRLNQESLTRFVPDLPARRVHICGPQPMMDATKSLLLELDVPKDMIKMEAFGPAPKKPKAGDAPSANAPSEPADAQVTFQASGKTAPLPTEQTVLEAAEGAGVEIDYSCRAGTCGACKVKKLKGEVAMEVDDALDEAEKAEGIVLACQAKSKNDLTIDA